MDSKHDCSGYFRLSLAVSMIPGVILCLIYTAVEGIAAFALIPLLLSAAFGVLQYFCQKRDPEESSAICKAIKNRILTFIVDVLLAAGTMTMLVFLWIQMNNPWTPWYRINRHDNVVGTYATVPLLYNFFVHLFFALKPLVLALWRRMNPPMICANCHHVMIASSSRMKLPHDASGYYGKISDGMHASNNADARDSEEQERLLDDSDAAPLV